MKKIAIKSNLIYSLVLVLIVILFMGNIGDYFFDANDDVLIKDIISGAYTGTPEGHNMQLLYPISFLLSLFYSVIRGFDWYGFFLCFAQYLCVFFIAVSGLKKLQINKQKVVLVLFLLFFSLGTIGSHFLFIHYTFTCGFMSATAAFLLLMHESGEDKYHFASVILVLFAYLLRTEMLLLTFPMVLVAFLIKWLMSKEMGKEFKELLIILGVMIFALLLGNVIHIIEHGTPKWKEFTSLFDARTELYDFQNVPKYDENKEFYDGIGLDESEQKLLENYNFGLDDEIDADVLNAVADHWAGQRNDEKPFAQRLSESVKLYLYRIRHFEKQRSFNYPNTDFPWNYVTLILYLGVLFAYLFPWGETSKKVNTKITGLVAILFACRTSLWLFIIIRGRDPIRITHPLYLVEIMILLALLVKREEERRHSITAVMIIASVLCLLSVPNQVGVIKSELASKELMREQYDALYDYFGQNKDKYYFVDVYTSVSADCEVAGAVEQIPFAEKLYENVDNTYHNHDIMGGWACKSPLYDKKLKKAGLTDMQSALLKDKVFFVQKIDESTDWLVDYYDGKGITVTVDREGVVAGTFAVYSVNEK